MTTNYTAFIQQIVQAFPDYVTDIDTSTWAAQIDDQIRYNVQSIVDVQEVILNNGSTYTITIPGLTTGWYLIGVTVVGTPPITTPATIIGTGLAGQGYLTISQNDQGASPITGKIPLYGASFPSTMQFPGIIFLSTYNMTANPTITSQLDNSIFKVFVFSLVEDGG